jgi:acetyl esterase/lipase
MTHYPDELYAAPGGSPLRCDVFRPDGEEPLPSVVLLHGGGWVSGDKRDVEILAQRIAGAGYVVACPNYRLAPLYAFPCMLEDLREFLRFWASRSDEYGVDPELTAAVGSSAGAYRACMLGVMPFRADGKPAVQVVGSMSTLSDLTRPKEQHFPVCWSMIEQYMGCPYEENEDAYEQASPLFHVGPAAAEFLLIHGEADDIVAPTQSETFAMALKDEGVPVELHLLPNEGHTLTVSAWENTEALLLDYLRRRLCHEL